MVSLKSVAALVAVSASFAAAQTNYTVDPNSIDPALKASWCNGQLNTCGTLCDSSTNENTCDPNTFDFSCLCASNNSAPGLQYYEVTMPTFLCQQIFTICNAQEVSLAGKDRCEATRKANCGTLNPANYTQAGTASTSSSASATAAPSSTASSASSPTTSKSAGLAPTMAANYGAGVVAAGIAAAFGLML